MTGSGKQMRGLAARFSIRFKEKSYTALLPQSNSFRVQKIHQVHNLGILFCALLDVKFVREVRGNSEKE